MTPKEAYLRAGKIHYEVCERSRKLIKPGASLLAIAEAIEKDIALTSALLVANILNIAHEDRVALLV